jgi:uncharacterized protein
MIRSFTNILFFCLISLTCLAQFPKPQYPPRLYNNFSSVSLLTESEEKLIESQLVKFEKETSNEIAVIIVDNLNGMEPWDYAAKIGEEWGVGNEKEDNGIVVLIKPVKNDESGKKVTIGVGRGLEAVIPDITANEIIENEFTPNFKNKNYYLGLKSTIDVLSSLAKKEYNYKTYAKKHDGSFLQGLFALIVIIVIIVLIIRKGGRGGGMTIGGGGFIGGFGGFGGFGGGFGGSSGGSSGFGGFGGGSFGGGGASGDW